MNRTANLRHMADEQFDLVIVGGGISGACLALDASLRGLKTALIERKDFGHATSASSSKLLHGGIRFLQQFRVDKVRESAYERVYFQNLVPHLCRYVPFVIPTFPGLKKGKVFLGAGAFAYQMLTLGQNRQARFPESKVKPPRVIGKDELRRQIPWLDDAWPATGGLVLPECHMQSSERVTLAILRAAISAGLTAVNYAQAVSVESRSGRVAAVQVRSGDDRVEIRTNAVANCAGPWLSLLDRHTASDETSMITSFSRGSHLVIRDLPLECALALPTTQKIQGMTDRGGRHVFLIPWRGHALLGTSYAQHGDDLDDVFATNDDRRQLLDAVNGALGRTVLTDDNIAYSYSGIYPLTAANVQSDVYQGASDYIVTDYGQRGGPAGYFSLFGAKYTTARKLAETACDAIAKYSGKTLRACTTRSATVPEADVDDPSAFRRDAAHRYSETASPETIEHLYANYGTELDDILTIAADRHDLQHPLQAERPNIRAEAIYCARHEMVEHLSDFVFRRTGLGTIGDPGAAALEDSAKLIASELNWSEQRTRQELDDTESRFRAAVTH
ncbi:MAG: glycerol-3-phosphate dehydrogenase/oxidase [Pseudomonadota bacterium]